jgi:hypothetical protein
MRRLIDKKEPGAMLRALCTFAKPFQMSGESPQLAGRVAAVHAPPDGLPDPSINTNAFSKNTSLPLATAVVGPV